jgi:DNA topoisomerase-2
MHLFNAEDKLKKYEKVTEIIDEYYDTRLKLYQERKKYLISALESDIVSLSNKCKYIKELLEDTIDLRKKKKDEVIKLLQDKGYNTIDGDNDYTYLTKMPMDSVTEENVDRLLKEHGNKKFELEQIQKTTIHQMWISELTVLKEEYLEYKEQRERLTYGTVLKVNTKKTIIKKIINKV